MEWAIVATILATLTAVGFGWGVAAWAFGFKVAALEEEVARLKASLETAKDDAKRAREGQDGIVGVERKLQEGAGAGDARDPVGGLVGMLRAADAARAAPAPGGPPGGHDRGARPPG